jgi:G3E family GTPase
MTKFGRLHQEVEAVMDKVGTSLFNVGQRGHVHLDKGYTNTGIELMELTNQCLCCLDITTGEVDVSRVVSSQAKGRLAA